MISKINFSRALAIDSLYEGEGDEGDDAAAKAAADKAAADAEAAAADETVKNQTDLNKVLKREKEKFRKEREKLIKQMEDLQGKVGKGMSDEERATLESQIEELRTANMTTEEQARRAREKAEKEWQTKFQEKESEAGNWKGRHDNLLVTYDITSASAKHKVLPNMTKFVEALLRPMTRLTENVDAETGKPNGTFTPKVKLPSTDKEGKPIELDLTIDGAIKLMKETPEQYGNLFEGHNAGGLGGGNSGTPGKAPNMQDLAKDPARYMEMRKKDPAKLGLA